MFAFLKGLFFPPRPAGKLMPESLSVVSVDEMQVACQHPKDELQVVPWSELKQVALLTNDQGPLFCDMYWHLLGETTECLVPQGATGEQDLITALQILPGVDNDLFNRAMCCSECHTFICWERKGGEPSIGADSR